jgi:hypothetical protein
LFIILFLFRLSILLVAKHLYPPCLINFVIFVCLLHLFEGAKYIFIYPEKEVGWNAYINATFVNAMVYIMDFAYGLNIV